MIKDCKNVIHFTNIEGLKNQLSGLDLSLKDSTSFFENNNLYARFRNIGVKIS